MAGRRRSHWRSARRYRRGGAPDAAPLAGAGQRGALRRESAPGRRSLPSLRFDAVVGRGHPARRLRAGRSSDLTLHLSLERANVVRYGENPHQVGARYRRSGSTPWWDGVIQHAGSALSYLNLFDADAAWRLVHELNEDFPGFSCVAIIKHANASGAALGSSLGDAFTKALAADPMSAFGGVVAIDGEVDGALAELIAAGPQADVIIASSFREEAIALLVARRRATRLLSAPAPEPLGRSVRTFGDTALVQNADELLAPVQ